MPLLLGIFLWCTFPAAHAQRPELRRPHEQDSPAPDATAAKKSKRGARAIGVVEFLPGGGTRLVPVALWWQGKYYDASLYEANPAPLALEPGTVYQALNDGEAAGQFVVNMPKLSNAGWIGDGRWTPHRAMDAQLAAEAAKQPKVKANESKAIFTGDADNGPPVLRRPGSEPGTSTDKASSPATAPAPSATASGSQTSSAPSTASTASPTSAPSTTTSDSSSGRPTLRRPGDEPDAAPTQTATVQPASSKSADDSDPDRPTLRKPTAPAAADTATATAPKPQPSTPAADENDPDRPTLSRGGTPATHSKPSPQTKTSLPASTASAATASPTAGSAAAKNSASRSFAAISDAGKFETRPLVYATTPERQQQLGLSIAALALADIRAFAAKHPTGPKLPKNASLADYDLRLFDLDFSNSPTVILTAKLPVAAASSRPFAYYTTYVAHLDTNGDPVKVFSSVTDTTHLDVFPRLELIDALDADGNGRGDLLFRQYSDTSISYGLYRVFPYNMQKVFEGGASL